MDSANVNREHLGEHEVLVEMLLSLQPYNLLPAKLKLKLGCQLIVMQDLSIKCGLCNSTWVMLMGIRLHVLQVRLPDSRYKITPRMNLIVEEHDLPWVLYRC